jgi:hypothetical protein
MVGTLLTVVVPTIPGRESVLSRCLWSIQTQAPGSVEVLVVPGSGQLGDKATMAAHLAEGRHMVLVDDDDYLAADYMAHVLPALEGDPDFVGYRILQIVNGRYHGSATTRGDLAQFGRVEHGPTPKGATRTAIWRELGMKNHYTADRMWHDAATRLVRSSVFIDRNLYVYDHHERSSVFIGDGSPLEVGTWPYDPALVRWVPLG